MNGTACAGCAFWSKAQKFKPFRPLALVEYAQAAMNLVVTDVQSSDHAGVLALNGPLPRRGLGRSPRLNGRNRIQCRQK